MRITTRPLVSTQFPFQWQPTRPNQTAPSSGRPRLASRLRWLLTAPLLAFECWARFYTLLRVVSKARALGPLCGPLAERCNLSVIEGRLFFVAFGWRWPLHRADFNGQRGCPSSQHPLPLVRDGRIGHRDRAQRCTCCPQAGGAGPFSVIARWPAHFPVRASYCRRWYLT